MAADKYNNLQQLAVLPVQDIVIFPNMVTPVFVSRSASIAAVEHAIEAKQAIVMVYQKDPKKTDSINRADINQVATLGHILQSIRLPDDSLKVLIEAEQRVLIDAWHEQDHFLTVDVVKMSEQISKPQELVTLTRTAMLQFEQYAKNSQKIPPELIVELKNITDISFIADTIATHMPFNWQDKQVILAEQDCSLRLHKIIELIEAEIVMLNLGKDMRGKAREQMDKNQREYYLQEQLKAIQKEISEINGVDGDDFAELENSIRQAGMPADVEKKALKELTKLRAMPPMSSEVGVMRNYIDWLIDVPWQKISTIKTDIVAAQAVLDSDHYALEKVKQRILEYLAVTSRVKKLKGPILCLVGPPGVGKTSLGRSIAKATGREFVRFSLGGMRDEAEIRGHRRTYVGAMPGKIIQMMKKAGTKNPLILLDEIDKMGMDMRGDPASALLEVLDSEQNTHFNDHYLEVDYDLSDVMFVATANSLNIPDALLDRMEIIRLAGYTEDEKKHIAKQYLLPKQCQDNGVKENELALSDSALLDIIRYYTREAGVRSLEREIASVCRKVVKNLLSKNSRKKKYSITPKSLEEYLGVQRYRYGIADEQDRIGHVTGLAWTQVGGELLTIEVASVNGKGGVQRTGNLEKVMKESIDAAITVIRMRAEQFGLETDFNQKQDIHFHIPEGAIKKDGPSAGIGMCVALLSSLTHIPIRADVAMTGEITLRGEVLPIGGLKEKLLAAHRGGIKTVIIPEENQRDLSEMPEKIKNKLSIHPVRWIDDVITLALVEKPNKTVELDHLMLKPKTSNKAPKSLS